MIFFFSFSIKIKRGYYKSLLEHRLQSAILSSNYTSDQIKKSVSLVNIYYDDLYYTVVEDSPQITFDILLGSLGRFLGLGIFVLNIIS
jgi:Zn-finger domain-containing protein